MLLRLKRHPLALLWGKIWHPTVTINGQTRQYPWGDNEIAVYDGDPIELEIHVKDWNSRSVKSIIGQCSITLSPGSNRSVEYSAPAQGFCKGEIGPLGTTRSRGVFAQVLIVSALGGICGFMLIGLIGVVLMAATGQLHPNP